MSFSCLTTTQKCFTARFSIHIHTHTLVCTNGRATRSKLGLHKDTLTCSLQVLGIEPLTLWLVDNNWSTNYLGKCHIFQPDYNDYKNSSILTILSHYFLLLRLFIQNANYCLNVGQNSHWVYNDYSHSKHTPLRLKCGTCDYALQLGQNRTSLRCTPSTQDQALTKIFEHLIHWVGWKFKTLTMLQTKCLLVHLTVSESSFPTAPRGGCVQPKVGTAWRSLNLSFHSQLLLSLFMCAAKCNIVFAFEERLCYCACHNPHLYNLLGHSEQI